MQEMHDVDILLDAQKLSGESEWVAPQLQAEALILIAGVADLAGLEEVENVAGVLQSLAAVVDSRWEEEGEDCHYSDEENRGSY